MLSYFKMTFAFRADESEKAREDDLDDHLSYRHS